MTPNRFVILSGCSGGGKSTLLDELARRGFATVEEPGRRIVREALAGDRRALPWVDMVAFTHRAIDMALADREAAAAHNGWVFFDRGLIDAASALSHLTGDDTLVRLGGAHRYHQRVFLAPPWPEIYAMDAERRHGLQAALPEYERLNRDYPRLGYEVVVLPKLSVNERADFVLKQLGA
jgi:predicted ATPase